MIVVTRTIVETSPTIRTLESELSGMNLHVLIKAALLSVTFVTHTAWISVFIISVVFCLCHGVNCKICFLFLFLVFSLCG